MECQYKTAYLHDLAEPLLQERGHQVVEVVHLVGVLERLEGLVDELDHGQDGLGVGGRLLGEDVQELGEGRRARAQVDLLRALHEEDGQVVRARRALQPRLRLQLAVHEDVEDGDGRVAPVRVPRLGADLHLRVEPGHGAAVVVDRQHPVHVAHDLQQHVQHDRRHLPPVEVGVAVALRQRPQEAEPALPQQLRREVAVLLSRDINTSAAEA